MRIGKLNTPFLLQSEGLVADGAGGNVAQWTTLTALWGNLAVASEETPADVKRNITHHVVVRYREDFAIQTGQRLVFEDRVFLIRSVSNIGEEDRWLKLFVQESEDLT